MAERGASISFKQLHARESFDARSDTPKHTGRAKRGVKKKVRKQCRGRGTELIPKMSLERQGLLSPSWKSWPWWAGCSTLYRSTKKGEGKEGGRTVSMDMPQPARSFAAPIPMKVRGRFTNVWRIIDRQSTGALILLGLGCRNLRLKALKKPERRLKRSQRKGVLQPLLTNGETGRDDGGPRGVEMPAALSETRYKGDLGARR